MTPFKLPKLPKINIPDAVKEKFVNLIKTKGMLAALELICPLEINMSLLANVTYDGVRHDVCAIFNVLGDGSLFEDAKDLEAFLWQMLAERGSDLRVGVKKLKYRGKNSMVIFIDRPQKKAA